MSAAGRSQFRVQRPVPGRSRGAVLVVGLIFLVLLMLIGVTAYSVATQEERMAGNTRDRIRAFEAAEVALRDCELLLSQPIPPSFSSGGAGGMYTAPAVGQPEKWETLNWSTDPTRQVAGPQGVAENPRCIVEKMDGAPVIPSGTSIRAELPQATGTAYRVTARGVGANGNTIALLQSFFQRD